MTPAERKRKLSAVGTKMAANHKERAGTAYTWIEHDTDPRDREPLPDTIIASYRESLDD